MASGTLPLEPPIDLPAAHIAAGWNQIEKLSRLIHEDKEASTDPRTHETVLHAAARNGAIKSAKWIVDSREIDCTAYAKNGYTAAHYAAFYGHLGVLKILLTQDDRQLESKLVTQTTHSDENLSVLSLAAIGGNSDVVEWLLNNFGPEADVPTSKGRYATHFAAAYGKLDVVTRLVRILGEGIIHKKDKQDTTPVFLAAQQGCLDVLSYLVNDLGADAKAEDREGFNSVHAATQAGQTQCVKWLVAKLGSRYIVSKTGKDGATPLHMAAASGNLEVLRYFLDNLENKNDVNVADNSNYTPLHDAAEEGVVQTVQLLLRHGARGDIKNKDGQTPVELAKRSGHGDIAAIIRDHTISRRRSKQRDENERRGPRTSRQETEEVSTAIQQQAEVLEQRKEKQLSRQASLQDLGLEPASTKDTSPLVENDDEIEHTVGPKGDLYANPRKLRSQHKKSLPPANDYDIEGFSSDPQSSKHQHQSLELVNDEGPYAVINDSASLISRDRRSRVRRHYGQDTDSDVSGVTGRSGRHGHSMPRPWYPGAYEPVMFGRKGPRSVSSSKHSSKEGSQHSGYPPMMGPIGYGYPYFAGMPYPPYWAPPQAAYGMSPDGRMHGQPPMIPPGMSYGVYPHPRMQPQRSSKRQVTRGKGSRHKQHDNMSPISPGLLSPKKHTDQDIGYGPSVDTPTPIKEDIHDHPLAPPVTSPDGFMDESADVSKFSSNIIMSRKSDQVREVEGITLNPSKAAPDVYDGRYDEFITTDSDYEFEIDEQFNVGLLAEAAAILTIGCVAGLKGLSRIRKRNSSTAVVDRHRHSERHGLSSAWDDTHGYEPSSRKRRGSINENIRGMSPEEFANIEDLERETWAKEKPKPKKAKQVSPKKEKDKKESQNDKKKSVSSTTNDAEVQNELITPELHKESYQSVSKNLGQKILTDALGAMHSSMLQIAPSSGVGSRMTSGDEGEEDDDDFGDTISLLEGKTPGEKSERKRKAGDETTSGTEHSRVNTDTEVEDSGKSGKKKKDKKEKKSKGKEKKEKDKVKNKEKKNKKHSERKPKKEKKKEYELTTPKQTVAKEEGARQQVMVTKEDTEAHTKPAAPLGSEIRVPEETPEKKVYPKEKHPRAQMPTVDQQVPPKERALPKPELEVKPLERKRSDTKPKVLKPATAAKPFDRKASETKPAKAIERKRSDTKVEVTKPVEKANTPQRRTAKTTKVQAPVKVPVKTAPPPTKQEETSSSREVINDVSMFDAESSEDEEPPPVIKPSHAFIDDDMSRDIFGDDGLAELNEALRQLEDIKLTLNTETQPKSGKTPQASKSKAVSASESKSKGQQDKLGKSEATTKSKREQEMVKSAPPADEMRLFSYEDGDLDFSDQDDIPSIPSDIKLTNGIGTSTMETQTYQLSRVTSASQQTGSITVQSTGVQGDGSYSSPFERNVLSILQALNETMQQMKDNPSASQSEINQHELLQQQMIQNLIAFSQKDPDVIQKLLALLKDKQSPSGSDNNGVLEDLKQKLVEAQERQRREASEHFRSQTEFHQLMKRHLEETAEMQMKGIESNFEKYTRTMSEQLADQMRRWEENMKKREEELEKKERESKRLRSKSKKKKKNRKHRYSETSETGSTSGSEVETSGLIQPSAKIVVATKPAIKTDTAKIVRQNLLDEDDMRTSSMPKVLAEKKQQMMKRRDTRVNFDHSRDALKRFESPSLPAQELNDTIEDSGEDEDEEMQFQHARPVTLKRADIKKQLQNTGYTPHRPQSAHQAVAEKRVVPVKGDKRPEHSDLAGAGDELAAVLKKQTYAL